MAYFISFVMFSLVQVMFNIKKLSFCMPCRSSGQSGLREDMRVVQRGSAGQSNRRRAEPGQRRGAEGCS